jgi:phosphoketolase
MRRQGGARRPVNCEHSIRIGTQRRLVAPTATASRGQAGAKPTHGVARLGRVARSVGNRAPARLHRADGRRTVFRARGSLFTIDRTFIINFRGCPWLVHRLAYRRTSHRNLHVRGYQEKGNINPPLELAIQSEIDRFSLAIDVIDRVARLHVAGAHAEERLRDMQIECRNYACEHGVDKPAVQDWRWPYQ